MQHDLRIEEFRGRGAEEASLTYWCICGLWWGITVKSLHREPVVHSFIDHLQQVMETQIRPVTWMVMPGGLQPDEQGHWG